ncbi:DUF916 and DUF3324 domain-containing protein [Lacticaseibacillus mingshuiensis]|uniref:DUF916 and DUF3324 domain-containing protein n=1 Tax=Lacticaseibacillus mingshuiensis TaxID=2799574 RepID=UPI0019502CAF|nr:DUF916 and DUF3324 domain-containing protein [Lacticaseibacillus mingshuiensis]
MKRRHLIIALLAFLGILFSVPHPAQAADGAGFTVAPALPTNQMSDASYFDLLVKPDSTQHLRLALTNLTDKEKTLTVTPTNAFTQTNGVVSYAPNSAKDESAEYQLNDLLGNKQTVKLKAGETLTVDFTLTIPKEGFKGQIFGGLYVTDEKHVDRGSGKGMTINNKYAMVVAVNLQTSKKKVDPDLKLNEVYPGAQTNKAAVIANLQNPTPRLFGQAEVVSTITRSGSEEVVLERTVKNFDFAPNTNVDFATYSKEPLKPGKYVQDLLITTENDEWHFRKTFTISQAKADKVEKELGHDVSRFPWWIVVVSVIAALLLGGLIWFLLWRRKKRQENDAA